MRLKGTQDITCHAPCSIPHGMQTPLPGSYQSDTGARAPFTTQLLDERKAARHAAQVAEAERLELHARIEEVLREMAQVKARLGSYEIELPNAAQRHHQAEAQVRT